MGDDSEKRYYAISEPLLERVLEVLARPTTEVVELLILLRRLPAVTAVGQDEDPIGFQDADAPRRPDEP